MSKTPETDAYRRAFREAAGIDHDRDEVVAFGDGGPMADELAELVVRGPERATAGLRRDHAASGEPLPEVGGFVVVVDGGGRPRCVWRTTDVVVKALVEVDDAFAWDEGEGDRTRAGWLDDHRRLFARQAEREGCAFSDGTETVFERFGVVWPPEAADRR